MNLLNISEVAKLLEISSASVRNWEKKGYLKQVDKNLYHIDDIKDLKNLISIGEIDRLNSRANKLKSRGRFIPTEYIEKPDSVGYISSIVDFVAEYNIKPEQVIFLLTINLLIYRREIKKDILEESLLFEDSSLFKRESIFKEMRNWFLRISNKAIDPKNRFCNFLLTTVVPDENDVLGLIYQSIIQEGAKSRLGSYYSPAVIVNEMLDHKGIDFSKVLDPCCGTGQFLLSMAERVDDPKNVWGADIDPVAVQISRLNLLLFYDCEFTPNVFNINTLVDFNETGFSFIATNPPWGAKIDHSDLKQLRERYPDIKSKESFSFFLDFATKKLMDGGHYSFILPESILYVKNHQDIRSLILNSSSIEKIHYYGRVFKKVFSPAITVTGKKSFTLNNSLDVVTPDSSYTISQNRFMSNSNFIFDIFSDNDDQKIIEKVYSKPYQTLKDAGEWALGVVTGDNKKHLRDEKSEDLEPIFRGKDIKPFSLDTPGVFINFNREEFQQCAPNYYFRADEKLVYKFISSELCFAYDNKKSLTLNSANILIPELEGYSVMAICTLLNSKLYNFIFKKKFKPLKILRGDIETLPFPVLDKKTVDKLGEIGQNIINKSESQSTLDEFVYDLFDLSEKQKEIVNFYQK